MMFPHEPYNLAIPETPSDTQNFMYGLCDAVYCPFASDITVVMQNDQAVLFTAVPIGILPVQCKRINATGSGAGPFVALYRK